MEGRLKVKMKNFTRIKAAKSAKKMFSKRVLCLMTVMLICATALTGCSFNRSDKGDEAQSKNSIQNNGTTQQNVTDENYVKQDITIAALKGPTAIGMVEVMENAQNGTAGNNYTFKISGTADEFTAVLIKGDIQMAALPCNAAATLYNKSGGKIKVMGVNTLGVLYILDTNGSIQSVNDLKGKTIYSTGKGTTPEYTLRYLLKSAGIDPDRDVTIEFKSEASEVAALLASGGSDMVAMLPQPYVTTVMNRNSNVRIALDVTKEWEKLTNNQSTVVTGVIAVNSEFANKNPEAVKRFMQEYKKSAEFVNSDVKQAAALVEKFGIFNSDIAEKAIPYCNITLLEGNEMKDKISAYLKVLYDENPASIGQEMPKDDFYFMVQ